MSHGRVAVRDAAFSAQELTKLHDINVRAALVTGDHARHASLLWMAEQRRIGSPDLDDLVRGFQAGEDWATERLIRRATPRVTALVRRLLAWQGDVEDVVHDVFVAALMARKRFRGDARFETWITSIAINQCRAHNRRQWLRQKLLATWQTTDGHARDAAADETTRDELAQHVRQIIAELPHSYREVVVLFYLEQRRAAEVAKLLGLKTNTVEKRLSRARKQLTKKLANVMT